jgi:hypothetical protein
MSTSWRRESLFYFYLLLFSDEETTSVGVRQVAWLYSDWFLIWGEKLLCPWFLIWGEKLLCPLFLTTE